MKNTKEKQNPSLLFFFFSRLFLRDTCYIPLSESVFVYRPVAPIFDQHLWRAKSNISWSRFGCSSVRFILLLVNAKLAEFYFWPKIWGKLITRPRKLRENHSYRFDRSGRAAASFFFYLSLVCSFRRSFTALEQMLAHACKRPWLIHNWINTS